MRATPRPGDQSWRQAATLRADEQRALPVVPRTLVARLEPLLQHGPARPVNRTSRYASRFPERTTTMLMRAEITTVLDVERGELVKPERRSAAMSRPPASYNLQRADDAGPMSRRCDALALGRAWQASAQVVG